eukprot:TRINITY_DN3925_c0_g2_i1.p1 TRINITY_DN3925_c0_g2~~TRINITY_DN3925_c0_g2_i1.p1  ORF type:complete len:2064 (-),score=490.47 TRINITY_DN3925_c0_g2_i1:42-6233(-)
MSMDPPTGGAGQSENPLRESLQISAIDDLLSELDGAAPRPASPAPAAVVVNKADDRNSLSAELDAFLEDMAAPITTGSSSSPAANPVAPEPTPEAHIELKTQRTLYEDLEAAIADVEPAKEKIESTPVQDTPADSAPEPEQVPVEKAPETEQQAAPKTPVQEQTPQEETPQPAPVPTAEVPIPEESPFDDIAVSQEPTSSAYATESVGYATDAAVAYSESDYSVAYATDEEMATYSVGYAAESVEVSGEGYASADAVYAPSANALELNTISLEDAAAAASSGRNWNAEFLALRALPSDSRDNIMAKCREYQKLASEFVNAAVSIGTKIIEENWLAPSDPQRTIQPVNVGGIAGGRKYISQGIFFKFALDSGMYGSDENAAKAAGLELKAVNAIFENYEIIGLGKVNTVPIVLINYLGYRLIATPTLPINSQTLVYGSADAGVTVHTSDAIFNKEMDAIAARLNLAPHLVGKSEHVLLGGPVDIEGHVGLDGNRYILDTARLMPPEAPGFFDAAAKTNSVWIRHLRPEAVVRAPVALNSDAYTGFNKNADPKADRDAVASYTAHIYESVLPAFTSVLRYDDVISHDFVHQLHDAGLNVRMLGHIRKHAKSSDVKKALMEHMLARSFKSLLFEKFRRVKNVTPSKLTPLHKVAAEMLSLLIGTDEASDKFWSEDLLERVRAKFGRVSLEDLLDKSEGVITPSDAVRANITTRVSLLLHTLRTCGIQLTKDELDALMDDHDRISAPILPSHIAKLVPTMKVSSNVYGEEGWRADTNLRLLTGYEHLDPDQASAVLDHFIAIYGEKSIQVADALAKIMAGTLSEVADDKLSMYTRLYNAAFAADFDFLSRTLLELRQDDAYWVYRLTANGGSIKSVVHRLENILGAQHPYLAQIYLSVATLVAVIASRPSSALHNVPEQFLAALPENPAEDLCDDALIYLQKGFEFASSLTQSALAQLLGRAAQAALKIISIIDSERPISVTRWTNRLEAFFGKADSPVVASFDCGLAWIASTSPDRIASSTEKIPASVPAQRALHVLERLYGGGHACTVHVNALLGIALSQDTEQTSKDSALIVLEQMLQHMETLFSDAGAGILYNFPYFEKALYAYRTSSPATGYDRLATFEEKVVALLHKYVVPFRPQAAKIAEFYSLTAQSHRASSRVVGASGIELDGDEAIMLGMQANAMMSDVSDAWDAVNGPYSSRKVLLIDSANKNRLYAAPVEKRDPLLLPMAQGESRSQTTFNGEWIKGRFAGTATVEFSTLMKSLTGIDSVFASWQEGLPHGMARIIYCDGSVYEGPVSNGVYEGKGIMTNPDGSKYAGPFVGGLMNGSGFFLAAGSTTPITKHYRRGKETNPDLRARYVTPQRKVSMPDFGAASRVDIPVDATGTLHGVGAVSWGDNSQFCLGVWRRGVLESAVFHTMDGYLSYTIYTSHVATLFFWNRVQTHFGGLFSNPNPAFLPGLISVVNQLLDSMQSYWAQPVPENLVGVELDNLKENKRGWEFGVAPLLRTSAQVFSDLLKGEPLDLGNLLNMMTTDVMGSAQKLTEPSGNKEGDQPQATTPRSSSISASTPVPTVAVTPAVVADSRSDTTQALAAAELEDALAPLRRRARAITPGTPRPPKVAAGVALAAAPAASPAVATSEPAAAAAVPTLAPPGPDSSIDRVPSVSMVSTIGAATAQDQATPRTPRATAESVSAGSGNSNATAPAAPAATGAAPTIVVQSEPASTMPDRRPSQANPALAAALRKSVQVNPATLNELFKQEAAAASESDPKPADSTAPASAQPASSPATPQPAATGQPTSTTTSTTGGGAAKTPAATPAGTATPGAGMSLAAQAGGLVRQQDKVIILGLPPMKQTVQEKSKNVEGWLHKRGNRGLVLNWTWKWRFFRISDDSKSLLYFKHKEVDANKAKGKIELAEVDRLEENKDFMCAFNVHIKGRTYVLQAQSLDQRKMWLTELQKRCPKVTTTNSFETMHSSMLAAVPQFMRPVASGGAAKSTTPPASPRPAAGSVSSSSTASSSSTTTTAPAASNVDATSGNAAVAFSPSEPAPISRPATQDPESAPAAGTTQ